MIRLVLQLSLTPASPSDALTFFQELDALLHKHTPADPVMDLAVIGETEIIQEMIPTIQAIMAAHGNKGTAH